MRLSRGRIKINRIVALADDLAALRALSVRVVGRFGKAVVGEIPTAAVPYGARVLASKAFEGFTPSALGRTLLNLWSIWVDAHLRRGRVRQRAHQCPNCELLQGHSKHSSAADRSSGTLRYDGIPHLAERYDPKSGETLQPYGREQIVCQARG
jgi:hypothetical protein